MNIKKISESLLFITKLRLTVLLTLILLISSLMVMAQEKPKSKGTSSSKNNPTKNKNMGEKKSDPGIIDIWTWQKEHAFVQGRIVDASSKIIFCAGQVSVDENGNPLNARDMTAQIEQALDNLEAVLAKGGAKLKDVVRMTYYVKDIPAFLKSNPNILKRYTQAGCNPTSTLIGVAALFHPDILFEVEATAAIQ